MELKIGKNNPDNITKFFFTPDYILLVVDGEQILLPYCDTELNLAFHIIRVDTPLHNRHPYVLQISSIKMILQSKEKTFQLTCINKTRDLLSALQEQHPFKNIFFQFQAEKDPPISLLAKELEQLFKMAIAGKKAELPSFFIISSPWGMESFAKKESYFMSPRDGLVLCIVFILTLVIFFVWFFN